MEIDAGQRKKFTRNSMDNFFKDGIQRLFVHTSSLHNTDKVLMGIDSEPLCPQSEKKLMNDPGRM